jgi:excisionase family DNA binding protein
MALRHTGILLTYDPAVDALAVELNPKGRSARTVQLAPGVNVDFDKVGRVLTLEILDASHHISRKALEVLPTGAESFTLAEAARESGLSATTLRTVIRNNRLPANKRGRDWYVDATDLLNYLESRDNRGRPPVKPRARVARGGAAKSKSTRKAA